jgi:ADP-heptose:LPS heptosyltransferase
MSTPRTILLSRTDSIGDVMLTLPLAGLLKARFPGVRIEFLGRGYTAPVLRCCTYVDEVLTMEDLDAAGPEGAVDRLRSLGADVVVHVFPERRVASLCKEAGIPLRIGTSHRWWHWLTCNERVAFSRRKSELHEAQLNVKLLEPLGITAIPSLDELEASTGFHAPDPDATVKVLLRGDRCNVVVHPLSKGSAVEWGLDHFSSLITALDPERFHVVVTGTTQEAERYRPGLPLHLPHVTDAGGLLKLDQLIALIAGSQALVAASTGPLHIAAACGVRTIGLYASKRPIHPGRWAPLGKDAHALVADTVAPDADPLAKIRAIAPARVLSLLEALR